MEKQMLFYRTFIEKEYYEERSSVYVAYYPTLGISDYSDTVEEVLPSIKDGIELAIEPLKKEGKEVPVDHVEKQIVTSAEITGPSCIKISFA
jgi:predicted RNase H-like HicB family nuclease